MREHPAVRDNNCKLICSRYAVGLPQLPLGVIARFGDDMRAYRDAALDALD